ncbi:MAG TPA: nitronate monooxygenase family protein [Acidimicrobiales bacterium]|nr:nitronate monooxygenase family protein [Acidimicrobiales bacterium]
MQTRVSDMLGVEFPILAFSHCRDVVAAVSNAGGFGVLGAVAHTPQQLEIDLNWIEEQTKGKPYGVDLLLPAKYADIGGGSSKEGGAGGIDRDTLQQLLPPQQQEFVDEILERYGVPKLDEGTDVIGAIGRRGGTLSVSPEGYEPLLDVAFAHDIKLIASALGAPPPSLIERAKGADVCVAALAGTRPHAERHKAAGVDLIVAQGTEAGGHTGEISTMVLVPDVVEAVSPTPVLAAGGIASGRQIAAAMALGAEGVWCGSVWLTTEEAETQPVVKQKFLKATTKDTVRSRSLTGKPARMLRSAWTDEWEKEGAPPPLAMPLQTILVAEAQARISRSSGKEGSGAQQLANYFVGQVVGQMNQVRPTRQVVLDMVTEYAEVAEQFAKQVQE